MCVQLVRCTEGREDRIIFRAEGTKILKRNENKYEKYIDEYRLSPVKRLDVPKLTSHTTKPDIQGALKREKTHPYLLFLCIFLLSCNTNNNTQLIKFKTN